MSLPTIYFEIGELEYSIEVESYSPPTNPTRDDPGDPGECELARFALVYTNGELIGCVPYNTLLLELASQGMSKLGVLDQAERLIYDKAMEACAEMEYDQEYDDDDCSIADDYREWDDDCL